MSTVQIARDNATRTPADREAFVAIERRYTVTGAGQFRDDAAPMHVFTPERALVYTKSFRDGSGEARIYLFGPTPRLGSSRVSNCRQVRAEFDDGQVAKVEGLDSWILDLARTQFAETLDIWAGR